MIKTLFELSICLKIETMESIDFITSMLNLEPTDSIKKGERKSVVLDESETNIWMYDAKYSDCNNTSGILSDFFENTPVFFNKIKDLKKVGTVTMRLSVISDFAQIGFAFSEGDLSTISRLQIPLEISVFSWGRCIDQQKSGDEEAG